VLKGSRISGTVDMDRLARAVSGPGIDTRVWVSQAIVRAFKVKATGVFAEVVLIPSGVGVNGAGEMTEQRVTARVGPIYAGNGFGFYAPLEVDDEVLVTVPEGVTDSGVVVVARLWSASDPTPQTARDHPADVVLHVREDKDLRIYVGGGGKVRIAAGGTESPAAREGDPVNTPSGAIIAACGTMFLPNPALPLPGPDAAGFISLGSSKVNIG
jgi:hypothetical protein